MYRRLLAIDAASQSWRLWTLQADALQRDPREDYFVLSGEALCQYVLRRDQGALVIARGPLAFLAGNKASVGYVSPLTGVPHYSIVGGRAAAQLLNLGLDAIYFQGIEATGDTLSPTPRPYIVLGGRAPGLTVEFKESGDLPGGQRSAFYHLLERELGGDSRAGSIFTLGEAARQGYRAANLAADAIYHAGRGGAGAVFGRFASALVLHGRPMEAAEFFAGADRAFARDPNAAVAPLLAKHCARLRGPAGGTIVKLFTSGRPGKPTLPARNAQELGYALADIGGPRILKATRHGHTGCHWCPVDCRHWHWVPADYAPGGRDVLLDDFEPTYALLAMLGLKPPHDTFRARVDFLAEANQRLILPLEQLGADAIDIGLGLAALCEGVERGLIPQTDAPGFMALGSLEAAAQAVALLRSGEAAEYPALRAVADGPQALAEMYPAMRDVVFTCGRGTLGNAGHCNALWTFLMPFSRFFGHYSGQFYKVEEELPAPGSTEEAYRECFARVVARLLERECYWLIGNALSQCAFTFAIFSQDGQGERLADDGLLVRILRAYGIQASRADLEWFGQAFWAQSVDLKCRLGWQPPLATTFPRRVYEGLSLALGRTPEELQKLMDLLIVEWRRQAGAMLLRFGYDPAWPMV